MSNLNYKEKATKVIDSIDFSFSNSGIRIILTIFLIGVMFSGLHIFSSKAVNNNQIKKVEILFVNKDPKVMQEVLLRCKGNLYDPDVVQKCVATEYSNAMRALKVNKIKYNFFTLVWMVGTVGVFSSYTYLLYRQNKKQRFGE